MIIPGGYAQVNFRYGGAACPTGAENVLGVLNTVSATPTAIAVQAITFWTNRIAALCTTELTLVDVLVKNGPNLTGPAATVASGQTGAAAPPTMTPVNALLVHKNTALGGRHGRGRLFLPGITEGTADGSGIIAGGTITIYDTHFNNFLADFNSAGLPLVLLHGDATTPTPITAFSTDSMMSVQRHRQRR